MLKVTLAGFIMGFLIVAASHWQIIAGAIAGSGEVAANEKPAVAATMKPPSADRFVGAGVSGSQAEVDELKHEEEQIGSMIRDAQSNSGSPARRLSWPLPKNTEITSPFGMRKHPILGVDVLHAGIDIAARQGVPVKACGDGRVIAIASMQAYGTIVIIDHGGELATVYAHLSSVDVVQGQAINTGQIIGKTGQTGNVTGPHLHLEVRVNGEPENPLDHVPLPK